MSNERLKFWIKCPGCKQPFGVDPGFVIKYLARVIEERRMSPDSRQESLSPAQETRPAPTGKAEYKASRRNYQPKSNTNGK